MRWFTAAVITVAVALLVVSLLRRGPTRYSAGPLEVRIVERAKAPTGMQYLLSFDDQRLLTSNSATVALTPGTHELKVEVWPRVFAYAPPQRRTLEVIADGAPRNEVFEVPFGEAFFTRLFSRKLAPITAPWSTPPMLVAATLPDGAPAAGAWFTCGQGVFNLDANGRGECPRDFGAYTVQVGLGALGAVSSEDLRSPFTPVLGPEAINFKPKVRAPASDDEDEPMLELTVNSKDQMIEQHYADLNVVMPGLKNQRAIACLRRGNDSVCDVIPADAGLYEPDLVLGEAAQFTFTATLAGTPLKNLIVYLDRVRIDVQSAVAVLNTSPGRHVLVLNIEGSEARHERIVELAPGQRLELGTLALE